MSKQKNLTCQIQFPRLGYNGSTIPRLLVFMFHLLKVNLHLYLILVTNIKWSGGNMGVRRFGARGKRCAACVSRPLRRSESAKVKPSIHISI